MHNRINWKQFFVSVLGTAIGVALTFSLNGMRESRKKDRAQRLTAIMIIHDIDNSIDIVKSKKETEAARNGRMQSLLGDMDQLKTMPYDTLVDVVGLLMKENGLDFRFDTSKEKIFHSGSDTWHNLGSMKFIDNVEYFFFDRQTLENLMTQAEGWVEPIDYYDDYQNIFVENGQATPERYAELLSRFLKEKLSDKRVLFYINNTDDRIKVLDGYIDNWKNLNNENKFLMGITDEEMDAYINSMRQNGVAVKRHHLLGTWEYTMEDNNSQAYTFRKDNSFSLTARRSSPISRLDWTGWYRDSVTVSGTWTLQRDSLILMWDSGTVDLGVDASQLEPPGGRKDSLDAWVNDYLKEQLPAIASEFEGEGARDAYKVRMDPSDGRLERTSPENEVIYFKRKK